MLNGSDTFFAEKGNIVSLVSSGDPGIYGMIGLIYEILAEKGWKKNNGLYVGYAFRGFLLLIHVAH